MDAFDARAHQALIPGLPDDLALLCLAKISHGYHGLLECVSKRWRDAIRSVDYARLKATKGWCGNWLFVSKAESENLWDAYDPDADRWHFLPRMPSSREVDQPRGFSGVCVCNMLLVIGGSYISTSNEKRLSTNEVMLFDPFIKQWSRAASMHMERSHFACAVICDKVFVAGGSSATEGLATAEVYDPQEDRWEDLPPMPFPLTECFSISHGGQFHVIGRREINVVHDTYCIFNPVEHTWHTVEDLSLFMKLSRSATTVMNDNIYTIQDDGNVETCRCNQEWSRLGPFPPVLLPCHVRGLKPFGIWLVGLQQRLYVVGGLTLKYESYTFAFKIVKLDSTRFCDPRKLPLKWHDARPMRGQFEVLCCAVLEE